jgi:hypothetical protein
MAWGTSGTSKVVFNDNYSTWTDIEVVDTATAATPTKIVSQAHAAWLLAPGEGKVIYSYSAQLGAAAGLYVVAVP